MADKAKHKIRNLLRKFNKGNARKPIARKITYLKFGFVITEHENQYCPRCNHILNAGPNYQPKYCDQCGQKLNFSMVKWKEDKELGFSERRDVNEQIRN